ncbi:MAG: NAD(P)H-binding protein [Bacteroidetes bacterium]|jgi:putative NADH-flavin reductase|nr:NAD(P)H-binding protein [Bacteroidota bacterium]
MTIALFGASGRTGKIFLERALENDMNIKALVRNPAKIENTHTNLSIIEGDVLNEAKVNDTILGCDVVVSLLGHVKGSPEDLQSKATDYIVKSMQIHGIKRLISLTGGGVRDQEHDKPKFMDNLVVFIMKNIAGKGAKNALLDGIRHADIIRQTNLDWTIVRAPVLTDKPAIGHREVGYVGTVNGIKLTRADLAQFMLDDCLHGKYIKEMPFITNG